MLVLLSKVDLRVVLASQVTAGNEVALLLLNKSTHHLNAPGGSEELVNFFDELKLQVNKYSESLKYPFSVKLSK